MPLIWDIPPGWVGGSWDCCFRELCSVLCLPPRLCKAQEWRKPSLSQPCEALGQWKRQAYRLNGLDSWFGASLPFFFLPQGITLSSLPAPTLWRLLLTSRSICLLDRPKPCFSSSQPWWCLCPSWSWGLCRDMPPLCNPCYKCCKRCWSRKLSSASLHFNKLQF